MSRFVISLDFELHWGVFDHTPLDEKSRGYFDRTRRLVIDLLEVFEARQVSVTWATVGMLFARTKDELEASLPAVRPHYHRTELDPYRLLEGVGENEEADPYHFAASLIEKVVATPGQCLGSHTFSHYYCLEAGQTAEAFAADLQAAQLLARRTTGGALTSLVFPRNQYTERYLRVVKEQGFSSYRTNPSVWFWRAQAGATTNSVRRLVRLVDHYLPLDAESAYPPPSPQQRPVNIPASRFLRPYLPKIDRYGGQRLKVRRICQEMTTAAREGKDYHLWWHPHNFATDPARNLAALDRILSHFEHLRLTRGMQSCSMEECAAVDYAN